MYCHLLDIDGKGKQFKIIKRFNDGDRAILNLYHEQNSPDFLLQAYGYVGFCAGKIGDIVEGRYAPHYWGSKKFQEKYPDGRYSKNLRIKAYVLQ